MEQSSLFLLCQLKQFQTLSLGDAVWRKEHSFWVQSALLTSSLISGFFSFGFLLLTAPATRVSGGSQPSKPFWTSPLVASPCSAAVRYFPRNNFSVSYHGAVLECLLSSGILVDGFPWNSREKFSSKPNTTVALLPSREPEVFTHQQSLNFSPWRRWVLSCFGSLSQPYW